MGFSSLTIFLLLVILFVMVGAGSAASMSLFKNLSKDTIPTNTAKFLAVSLGLGLGPGL
jgi:hypothetical protein